MQNRYVGDIGDYAKYALLRSIVSENIRLGVVWCLHPDEAHNADGRHTSYLQRMEFHHLDSELHDKLFAIVRAGRRSVDEVRRAKVLPSNTVYFNRPVVPSQFVGGGRPARLSHRENWLTKALEVTVGCNVVFFDPDNGLEVASVPKHHTKAGKYIFLDELNYFWQRGQSIVLYHHLNRTASVQGQTMMLRRRFLASFLNAGLISSFLFRRGSCRHFWFLVQRAHCDELEGRIERMLDSGWRTHFEAS